MMHGYWLGLGYPFMLFMFVIALLLFIFWLWLFVDALQRRDVLWIVLFILAFFTGFFFWVIPLLYYFIEYGKHRERRKHRVLRRKRFKR